MKGRLPDPDMDALCFWCDFPRRRHDGLKHYGACPGLLGKRFTMKEEDKRRGTRTDTT